MFRNGKKTVERKKTSMKEKCAYVIEMNLLINVKTQNKIVEALKNM